MTLYAVHHAWIDGHAVKAPVGIWGEGGVSFYPPETENHRKGGSQAETEASTMLWSHWVEKRTEWGSTYGASWSAIESDEPMEQVLAKLQANFFSEPHPIKTVLISEQSGDHKEDSADSKEDSGQGEEDSGDAKEDSATEASAPAQRFVIAQSWWVASEIARRHPDLIIHEMHPGDGIYDCLALLTAGEHQPFIQLNRVGSIQAEAAPEYRADWADAFGARSPHALVKEIEEVAELDLGTKAPASTPRVLAYRFISTALNVAVNDRHTWDARNEFRDSSDDELAELNGYLAGFPEVQRDLAATPKIGLWHEPESHYWAILRDDTAVAIVSAEGRVYRRDRQLNLATEYEANGRRMLPLVVAALGDLLP